MQPAKRIPFQHLSSDGWRRLGIFALIILYLLDLFFLVEKSGVLNGVGLDFLAGWSAGKIADQNGFNQIYNIDLLKQIQYEALRFLKIPFDIFYPLPAPFFPVFITPFVIFSKVEPKTSYWIWAIVSLIVLAGYLVFFTRKLINQGKLTSSQRFLLLSLFLSFPVYSNFINGQVEVLLVICAGEFIRNSMNKKPLLSGIWLAGLLIKPQILILVLPALLIMKHWKVILGFTISASTLMLISLVLSGYDGLSTMLKLWVAFVPGIASSNPLAMANWRMVAESINTWTTSNWGWVLAGVGMVASLGLWIGLCRKRPAFGSIDWVTLYLGIFALSCAFTWHSHTHMGMVFLPFLLKLSLVSPSQKHMRLVDLWIFLYPFVYLISFLILLVEQLRLVPIMEDFDRFMMGSTGLFLYLFIAISIFYESRLTKAVSIPEPISEIE